MVAAAVRFGGHIQMNRSLKKAGSLSSKAGDQVKEWVVVAAITELFFSMFPLLFALRRYV